jgi:localization factor PodJL
MDEIMKRAPTWSIDGIKPDIREAAREAARRQGLTLSEWLNDIILEHASDLDIDADEMNSDDRLEAVAARLNQLDARENRQERPLRGRNISRDRNSSRARDISREREDSDFAPRFARTSQDYPDELEERRRLKRQERAPERFQSRLYDRPADHLRIEDAEAMLDAAIEAFDQRAAKSQKQTAQSVDAVTRLLKSHTRQRDESLEVLSDISTRLSDIETQITRQAVDEACGQSDRNSHLEVLPVVARRLADIESHLAKRPSDESYQPIRGALSRMEEQLESFAKRSVPPPPPQDDSGLKRLESKLDALLRSSAPGNSEDQIRVTAPQPAWRDSLQTAVTEIGRQQRLLNGDAEDYRVVPRREQGSLISARINKPAPQAARAADMHPLQGDIAALGAKLEAIRLQDFARDIDRIKAEIGEMSAGLAELAPRDSVTAIEAAIRNLTTRIETSREDGMRETLLRPLTELADDLRQSFDTVGPRASIEGLERDIKTISEKLETFGREPQEPAGLARLQEQTQEIHNLLKHSAAHPVAIDQIENKIAALAEQIERQQRFPHPALGPSEEDPILPRLQAESLSKIESRLEDLSKRVERAISAPPVRNSKVDSESLETLVKMLADKFEAAQDPKASFGAFEALQSQIAELAQRLERSDSGFSALTSLQKSVGDLFARLEDTRIAATATAENAAREAARAAVREVIDQPGLFTSAPQNDSDVTREIADLRSFQDEADRRTHSTLNAVHETLEKIVDRLAMLEEDIGDVQEANAVGLRLAEQASTFTRQRDGSIVQTQASERFDVSPRGGVRAAGAHPSADFLIEPGTLFPKSKEASVSKDPDIDRALGERLTEAPRAEPARSRADFIAAARRAAQAAQEDQTQRDQTPRDDARPRIPMAETASAGSHLNLVVQTRDFLLTHRRQLTLSIAALFLAVGAYAVVKTMTHGHLDVSANTPTSAVHNMAETRIDPKAEAPNMPVQTQLDKGVAPAGSVDQKAIEPAAKLETSPASSIPMMAGAVPSVSPKTIAGSDPIVTGSIVAPKMNAAPASDPAAAALAIRAQADAGNANAQYELATRYAEGRSVARDYKLAADWFEKAAARGIAPAAYRLGSLYEKGLGVARDFARAKSLYQKAAELGNARAMHNLAVLVAEGGDGKPDYANAAIWFRKAADFGIRDSQYNLAILYARGLGVQQDLVQSYMWFSAAAAQGDEDAGKKREDVAAKLDAKSLAQAKANADAFHPMVPDRVANEVQAPPGGWEALAPPPVSPKSTSSNSRPKISRL